MRFPYPQDWLPLPPRSGAGRSPACALLFLCATAVSAAACLFPCWPAQAAPQPAPTANSREWWLSDTWHVAQDVWPLSQGAGVTVAVIDTGVGNARYGPPEMGGGFVLPGINLHDGTAGNFDQDGHGTEMAGLIAARGTDGGYVGLAPKATILPIAVLTGAEVSDGIRWAVDHGAKVISVSMGETGIVGSCDPKTQADIDYAVEHDAIIVASAGNSGDTDNGTEAPAACPGVTAVGAVDRSERPWSKTQRKPYVAVAAPGVDVPLKNDSNEWQTGSGTSAATALVSATMALVWSKYPNLTGRQVAARVVGTADDVGAKGRDDLTGYGLVDPVRALTASVPKDAPNPAFDRYDAMKAAQRHAVQSSHRNKVLLIAGGVTCVALVLLTLVMLVVWSVRRDRRARRVQVPGIATLYGWPDRPAGPQTRQPSGPPYHSDMPYPPNPPPGALAPQPPGSGYGPVPPKESR